jgi:divalent metal cation (Fe/Co/Zn/Cd) transporter
MNTEPDEIMARHARLLQILVGSLAAGIFLFAGVVAFVLQGLITPQPELEVVTYVGFAMLAGALAGQSILSQFDHAARERIAAAEAKPEPWIAAFEQRTIIGCLLIEGAAFLCLIGAMLSGQPWGILAAVAGAVIMIGLHWPTANRIREYVHRQRGIAPE